MIFAPEFMVSDAVLGGLGFKAQALNRVSEAVIKNIRSVCLIGVVLNKYNDLSLMSCYIRAIRLMSIWRMNSLKSLTFGE